MNEETRQLVFKTIEPYLKKYNYSSCSPEEKSVEESSAAQEELLFNIFIEEDKFNVDEICKIREEIFNSEWFSKLEKDAGISINIREVCQVNIKMDDDFNRCIKSVQSTRNIFEMSILNLYEVGLREIKSLRLEKESMNSTIEKQDEEFDNINKELLEIKTLLLNFKKEITKAKWKMENHLPVNAYPMYSKLMEKVMI